MKNTNQNDQPTWLTNIYTPEGNDRPNYNLPIVKTEPEEQARPTSVAQIVSQLNNAHRNSFE